MMAPLPKERDMPLKTKSVTLGPVALVCATVCFIAAGLMLLFLITSYPEQAEVYIRPMIPSLITLGGVLVLWLRSHSTSEENRHISNQVAEAKGSVDRQMNGELDARIEKIVTVAIDDRIQKAVTEALAAALTARYGPPPTPRQSPPTG